MPAILTTKSTVQCLHGGRVATSGAEKLSVLGGDALLANSGVQGKGVSTNCKTEPVPGPPPSKKCTSVLSIVPVSAAKLTIGGQAVLLSLSGETDGTVAGTTPQPGLSASAGQTKLQSA